jgi:hypothetical protein
MTPENSDKGILMPARNKEKHNLKIITAAPSFPTFILAPRRLRIPDAAKYIAATNWFMEQLLREGEVPFQWSGKYKVVDVRDLDAWVDRQKQNKVA